MSLLALRPLGPLSISRRRVPGPADRAAYLSSPALVPPPTTVLGALGSALGVWIEDWIKSSRWGLDVLLDRIKEKLGCKPKLGGPLVEVAGRLYLPLEPSELLPLDKLADYSRLRIKEAMGRGEKDGVAEKAWAGGRTGISLDRGRRVVREGYLFSVGYSSPRPEGSPGHPRLLYKLGCETPARVKTVVRLGGESRLAVLELREGELGLPARSSKIHYVVSPVVFKTGENTTPARVLGTEGGAVVERVYWGRPELAGLGFDEATGRRRPLRYRLPAGTLLELDREEGQTWVGELAEFGFGFTIPVG